MAGSEEGHTTIIIRRKKGGGDGHHGGAWKVAYADFVTAMMAFFLLLWLLNATTTEQKLGISNYFDPLGAVKSQGGGEGVLGGISPSTAGAQKSASAPVTVTLPISGKPTAGGADDPDEDTGSRQSEVGKDADKTGDAKTGDNGKPGEGTKEAGKEGGKDGAASKPTDQQIAEATAKKEQAQFEKTAAVLRQAIQSAPELKDLADSLMIDQTPEGLRIQILDQERLAMFAKGSSRLEEPARRLLGLVAAAVKNLPNKLTLTGHTDSLPYAGLMGYSNWELSADRANAARKALVDAGLAPDRIASVVGKADKDHLVPDDPTSPRNRRISIVLLREAPPVAAAAAAAPKPIKAAGEPSEEVKKTASAAPDRAPASAVPEKTTMGSAAPRVIENANPPARKP